MRTTSLEALEPRTLLSAYYVATSGNDSGAGSSAAPWRTLQQAADSVRAGDIVNVRPGSYAGFHLTTSGTAGSRITFKAEAGVVLNDRAASQSYYMGLIDIDAASYITIDGFKTAKLADPTKLKAGIRSTDNTGVIIRNCVTDSPQWWGILTGFSANVLIENCTASNAINQHGIYAGNSADNPTIRGCTVFGNRQSGIQINADLSQGGDGIITGAMIENNRIYGNGVGGGSAVNLDGVQSSVIRNNLMYDNHASGISLYCIDGAQGARNNAVVNNTIVMSNSSSAPGRYALNIQNGSTGTTAANNVLYSHFPRNGGGGSVNVSSDSLSGMFSDYNIVNDSNGFARDDAGMSFAQWKSATAQDAHSLVTTPANIFTNATAFDFTLKAGSPAVDRAKTSLAPAVDIVGNQRPSGAAADIGAFESGGKSSHGWVDVVRPKSPLTTYTADAVVRTSFQIPLS